MKISTKTGDMGETSLFSGKRVPKNGIEIMVLGDLDELNSVLGWTKFGVKGDECGYCEVIEKIQEDLYRIMSIIANEFKCPENIEDISEKDIENIETEIVKREADITDLREFITPGISESSSRIFIARSVCRRAERAFVQYKSDYMKSMDEEQKKQIALTMKYLNRLSDLLFLLAYGK